MKLGINWTIVRRTNHASCLILPFFVCMTQTMSLANGLCKPDTAYNKLNNTEITYTLVFRFHNAVKLIGKKTTWNKIIICPRVCWANHSLLFSIENVMATDAEWNTFKRLFPERSLYYFLSWYRSKENLIIFSLKMICHQTRLL